MFPIGIEVKALASGVHASIGAAATLDLNLLVEDLRECCFDVILHSAALGLSLPAVEVGAVVGADTFPTHTKDCVVFGGLVKCEVGERRTLNVQRSMDLSLGSRS